MNDTTTTDQAQLDHTRERIRAFVHSMRPLRGVADLWVQDVYQQGRALIERLADSAQGEKEPTLRLTVEECAAVLDYFSTVEPFEPGTWWDNPEGEPSRHCGLVAVMDAMRDSLRAGGEPAKPALNVTAALMRKFETAISKLELAATHFSDPAEVCTENLGAAAIVCEVTKELNAVFLDLSDVQQGHADIIAKDMAEEEPQS